MVIFRIILEFFRIKLNGIKTKWVGMVAIKYIIVTPYR